MHPASRKGPLFYNPPISFPAYGLDRTYSRSTSSQTSTAAATVSGHARRNFVLTTETDDRNFIIRELFADIY